MKILRIIFIFLFIGIIIAPLILIDKKSTISEAERRTLASIPHVSLVADGKLNVKSIMKLPGYIDKYLNDRFGFRDQYITMMNNFSYYVLQNKHNDDVLMGKDDWLFYINKRNGDNLSDFLKQNLLTAKQLQTIIDKIVEIDYFCDSHGIRFLLLIAPEKHSIYPEKYPFPRPEGNTQADQVVNALPEYLRGKVIYPRDYLVLKKPEHKQPLYYPNGTHWNELGAYYVYQLLYNILKPDFPNIPDIEYKYSIYQDTGEDSIAYLSLKEKDTNPAELLKIEPFDGWESHYSYIKKTEKRTAEETATRADIEPGRFSSSTLNLDSSLPKALVFRDSFFMTLESFTSCIFSSAEYVWDEGSKKNYNYILSQEPDVFIWEIGERGLGQMLSTLF
jgi:hypothetical protein